MTASEPPTIAGFLTDFDHTHVIDVHGKGLLLAVEFDMQRRRDAVVEAGLRRGLLTLGCGTTSLRMLLPLDIIDQRIVLDMYLYVS